MTMPKCFSRFQPHRTMNRENFCPRACETLRNPECHRDVQSVIRHNSVEAHALHRSTAVWKPSFIPRSGDAAEIGQGELEVDMTKDDRDILELLKEELSFIEQGGYGRSVRTPWKPSSTFQDSLTCVNYGYPYR